MPLPCRVRGNTGSPSLILLLLSELWNVPLHDVEGGAVEREGAWSNVLPLDSVLVLVLLLHNVESPQYPLHEPRSHVDVVAEVPHEVARANGVSDVQLSLSE